VAGQDAYRGHLGDLGRDIDEVGPALLGRPARDDGIAPVQHGGVDVRERHRVGVEARMKALGQLVQGPQAAGHDEQPPASTQQWGERPQHARGAEVVGVDVSGDDLGRRVGGQDALVVVREDDVYAAVARVHLVREGGHPGGVANVDHSPPHLGPRAPDPLGGGPHGLPVASREIDDVIRPKPLRQPLGEGEAQIPVCPRDDRDPVHGPDDTPEV
jgi:hypothetical protein